jgi:hypothetical protein
MVEKTRKSYGHTLNWLKNKEKLWTYSEMVEKQGKVMDIL